MNTRLCKNCLYLDICSDAPLLGCNHFCTASEDGWVYEYPVEDIIEQGRSEHFSAWCQYVKDFN